MTPMQPQLTNRTPVQSRKAQTGQSGRNRQGSWGSRAIPVDVAGWLPVFLFVDDGPAWLEMDRPVTAFNKGRQRSLDSLQVRAR